MATNTFKFVGQIKPIKENGFSENDYPSGWHGTRLKFLVIAGENRHYMEISGGKFNDDSKNVVKTLSYTKEADGKAKTEKLDIAWEDRTNPEFISKVAPFKRFVVDFDTPQHKAELRKNGDKEEINKSKEENERSYITEYDFINCMKYLLDNGIFGDDLYTISGNIEISYSEKDGVYYRNFVPTRIQKANPDTEPSVLTTVDFYFTKECIDDTLENENNEVVANGYLKYYDRKSKSNFYANYSAVILNDNRIAKPLRTILSRCEADEVKHIMLDVKAINGSTVREVTYEDLTEDQQELIDMGIYTIENYNDRKIVGDKVSKNVIECLGSKENSQVVDIDVSLLSRKPSDAVPESDSDFDLFA